MKSAKSWMGWMAAGMVAILVAPAAQAVGDYHFENHYEGPWQWRELAMTESIDDSSWSCIGTASVTGYVGHVTNLVIPPIVEWKWNIYEDDLLGHESLVFRFSYQVTVADIGTNAFARRSDLESVVIPDTVTGIGERAFLGCTNLASVSIPDTVTNIAAGAFAGCTELRKVRIPGSVASIGEVAFQDCTGLAEVAIGNGVTSIGADAFGLCTALTEVTIPDSVTSIGNSAFRRCDGLKEMTIPDGVTSIGDCAFEDCKGLERVTIGRGVTSLGESAFRGCTGLKEVTVLGNVTNDCNALQPFSGCTNLEKAVLGGSMTEIRGGLLSGCRLTEITLQDGVTSIGKNAFSFCGRLREVAIPDSVTNIGDCAFADCKGLERATIGSGVASVGSAAFAACTNLTAVHIRDLAAWAGIEFPDASANPVCLAKHLYLNGEEVTGNLLIPDGAERIGDYAFCGCTNLTAVTIPDSAADIGEYAFHGCTGLTAVSIGNNVTSVGRYAFDDCPNLTEVTIGNGVRDIGSGAFLFCNGLTAVRIRDLAAWAGIEFSDASANPVCLAKHLYLNGEEVTGNLLIPDGAERIGDYAFCGCTNLTAVTIPDGVTNIGGEAFYECEGLTGTLTIPDSVKNIGWGAFCGCKGLADVTIGNGVTNIGGRAFYGCSLASVAIPPSVASVGSEAFYKCERLSSVHIGDLAAWCGIEFGDIQANPVYHAEHLYLGGEPLTGVLAIPDGVKSIGDYAFPHCRDLTGMTIPDSVGRIGDAAFYECRGLTNVTWGKNVAHIGDSAFCGCSGLAKLTIPDSVTDVSLGDEAFAWCTGLKEVSIGNGVTSIGSNAFYCCRALESVEFGNAVADIGMATFHGCGALSSVTILGNVTNDWGSSSYPFGVCTNLETVVLGGEMTKIGARMFATCSGLKEVVIPNTVTDIGDYAFIGCTGLTAVTIPDSVTRIGYQAFYKCANLESVTIPNSVTNIGGSVFAGCTGLATLYVPAEWKGTAVLSNVGLPTDCIVVYGEPESEIVDGVAWNYAVRNENAIVLPGDYAGDLAVPPTLGGVPVTRIAVGAFAGCGGLTSLAIPDGWLEIATNTFSGCGGLTRVEVPGAWYGTDKLAHAGLPEACEITYRGVETLAVATESLPEGTVGGAYSAQLAATGGREPYSWASAGNGTDYGERPAAGTFAATGTAQGWRGDDTCWDLALPFEFPYFGKTYTNAKVNSNGAISFGNDSFTAYSYSESTFKASPIVAVLWTDLNTSYGDIYVESGTDAVTVRWQGTDYSSGGAVNFSATLRRDGRIVLSYGEGNANGGAIGISAGGGTAALLSAKSDSGSMANADDIVFSPPTVLPEGLALAADGVLAGTPLAAGKYTFAVMVTDAAGMSASRELSLAVAGGGGGLLPEAEGVAEVAVILAKAADERLGQRIQSVEEYNAFRAWVAGKGLDAEAVMGSAHAWIAYALGAEGVFENEPTIVLGRVTVEGGGASVGVSVTVKDGEREAAVDAGKVAGMFEATGDLGDWSGTAKLSATATPTASEGTTMRFEVVPGGGTADKGFLRLAP